MRILLAALLLSAPLALVACQPADEVDTATDVENLESPPEVIVETDSAVVGNLDESLEAAGQSVGEAAEGAASAVGDAAQEAGRAVDANVDLGDNAEAQGGN